MFVNYWLLMSVSFGLKYAVYKGDKAIESLIKRKAGDTIAKGIEIGLGKIFGKKN